MSQNPFDSVLAHLPRPAPGGALRVLDEMCEAIQRRSQNGVTCRRIPGFVTNLGQEYRVTLASATGFQHILFRAHVPAGDFPVVLDFYDETPVHCDNETDMRRALVDFLRRPSTVDVIDTFMR